MFFFPAVIAAIECDDDRAVMTEIYFAHRALMFKTAWKYVQSWEDAEDMVSESCSELIAHFSTVRSLEPKALRKYIVTTVRNHCLNSAAKKKREKLVPLAGEPSLPGEERETDDRLPENRALLQDMLEQVDRAIGKLPEAEREVLYMRVVEQRAYEEIAETLGTTPENARKITERARKHMKLEIYGSEKI